MTYKVGADKAGSAGDNNIFSFCHDRFMIILLQVIHIIPFQGI